MNSHKASKRVAQAQAEQEEAQRRHHFVQTYESEILKMLAEANDTPGVHMYVRVAPFNSPADIELVQEVEQWDEVDGETDVFKEVVQISPVTPPQEEYKLDQMRADLNEKYEQQLKRQRAADLRKRRNQVLEQEFTKDELDLMEKYS